jgi:hypothetical protein
MSHANVFWVKVGLQHHLHQVIERFRDFHVTEAGTRVVEVHTEPACNHGDFYTDQKEVDSSTAPAVVLAMVSKKKQALAEKMIPDLVAFVKANGKPVDIQGGGEGQQTLHAQMDDGTTVSYTTSFTWPSGAPFHVVDVWRGRKVFSADWKTLKDVHVRNFQPGGWEATLWSKQILDRTIH